MASKTVITTTVPEQKTAKFAGVLLDETETLIPSSSLATLTLTLYNKRDLTIINGRNKQNILNTDGGTVDSLGNFTLTLDPADMIIVRVVHSSEVHTALVEWTYGSKAGGHEIEFTVDNLKYIG